MGQEDIIEKLTRLLAENLPFQEEAFVVYLMVEVRKILDRNNDKDFPLLRFYSDWCVHTAKDRITPDIRNIMKDVFTNRHPVNMDGVFVFLNFTLADFSQLEQVKNEMGNFFKRYNLPTSLLEEKNWVNFVYRFVNILADQPINNPCKGIKSFAFKPSPFGAVIGQIVYEEGTFTPNVHDFVTAY